MSKHAVLDYLVNKLNNLEEYELEEGNDRHYRRIIGTLQDIPEDKFADYIAADKLITATFSKVVNEDMSYLDSMYIDPTSDYLHEKKKIINMIEPLAGIGNNLEAQKSYIKDLAKECGDCFGDSLLNSYGWSEKGVVNKVKNAALNIFYKTNNLEPDVDKVTVIIKDVNAAPSVNTIVNDYDQFKAMLGGLMESRKLNDEGLYLLSLATDTPNGHSPNLYYDKDIINGKCIIAKFGDDSNVESLSEQDISFVTKELDKLTVRSKDEIKEGACLAVTPRRAYNAVCDESGGNVFYTIPLGEPIIGYLQTQLKQDKETTTKKESESRLTIEPSRIDEMQRDWDNETNDVDSQLWRDDITSAEENLINLWDKGYTQAINKLATEIVELTQEPVAPKESDEAERE